MGGLLRWAYDGRDGSGADRSCDLQPLAVVWWFGLLVIWQQHEQLLLLFAD